MSDIIYTRNELKALKEKTDRIIHENNVAQLVNQITNSILGVARSTTTTSYIYSVILPSNAEDNKYKIVMDVINKLKEKFIDASIEYKSQKDLRTGREFNHGIYIDWS
jgi:hypothetical protein